MTDQPEMTSNLGRQWLSQTSNTPDPANDPPNDLKSVSMNAASPTGVMGSIPVVSIPFFDTIDKTLGLVNQASGGQETGKQETDSSTAFVDANVEAVVASDSVKTATRVADLSQFSSPSPSVSMPNISIPNMSTPAVKSDRSEDPSDWMEKVGSPTTPRDGKANSDAAASEKYTSAIDGLVDSVLERFPLAAPTILLFVGSENNPHIDETCAELAVMLSKRNVGDVLLVDSNFEGQLTSHHNLSSSPGVSEIYNDVDGWESLVVRESASGLDFLPAGKGNLDRWDGISRIRQAAAEMKSSYQFICVSAGDAYSNASKTWSGICDGSYLIVSLESSNERIAESAVTELQSSGARLLGCVVTDS